MLPVPSLTGRQIAHFTIGRKLGEGGMGVVYEAVDQHLDRRAALKILPPEMVANAARKQRFIQEAKTASALNHSNIVTIYDISAADGVDYIAMELVPGQTLEDLLAKRRLKLQEVLRIADQISGAIASAHAAGIVHRDLKPANIMVTDNGHVKVLDFGLAKLTDRAEISEEDETQLAHPVTEEGTVLGSAGYMSPEQAEGKKVDHRSDIFAFGLVLYEMLSGKRAFRGGTRMATIAAILNQEPEPLAALAPGLPKELERMVARCLRKDLARRSQSMAEVKLTLEELKEEDSASGLSGPAVVLPKASRSRWRWLAAVGVVLALAAGLFFLLPGFRTATEWKEVPLTAFTGRVRQPALSPDGKQYAFAWNGGEGGEWLQIYVSLVGPGKPLRLTNRNDMTAVYPSWAPDGQSLAFVRPDGLYVIPALGGVERRLDDGADISVRASTAAWSPDGKWLYFSAGSAPQSPALFAKSSSGGERRRLTDPPAGYSDLFPAISPDGRQMVFVRQQDVYNGDLYICDLRDGPTAGPARRLTQDRRTHASPVWTGDGREIVYTSGVGNDGGLMRIYRVAASGGPPKRVEGIGEHAARVAIAPKANRLVYARQYADYNIYRMELPANGKPAGAPEKFLSSTRREATPSYSPDGKRIAFWSNRAGTEDIWVADADGSNPVQLTTFKSGVAGTPQWSPDGQTLAFDARPEGQSDIYSMRADGGPPKRLTDNPAQDAVPRFSADGRWIFYSSSRSGRGHLYRIPAGGGEPVQMTQRGGGSALASPDGKWIYFVGGSSLWKVPPEGGQETQVLPDGSMLRPAKFALTASGIYFAAAADPVSHAVPLRLLRFEDGKTVDVALLDREPFLQFNVSPDDKWLLFTRLDSSLEELILVENFH
ncbi:MAG: protein kinase [Candidatus Solibacter sp.]